jgi:hypothetical protein
MVIMKMSRTCLTVLGFVGSLALVSALSGCAAPTDDESVDSAGAESALVSNPEYDAVVRSASHRKVTTDSAHTAAQSASTHLIGFIPRGQANATLDRLLAVQRWTEIRDAEGETPFTRAQLLSNNDASGVRTVTAKITLDAGATLEIKANAKDAEGGAIAMQATNTTKFKHWLAGTILDENKLAMDVRLIPYEGGLIVDATMRVKLKKMEDKAPALTGSVTSIFDWLAR